MRSVLRQSIVHAAQFEHVERRGLRKHIRLAMPRGLPAVARLAGGASDDGRAKPRNFSKIRGKRTLVRGASGASVVARARQRVARHAGCHSRRRTRHHLDDRSRCRGVRTVQHALRGLIMPSARSDQSQEFLDPEPVVVAMPQRRDAGARKRAPARRECPSDDAERLNKSPRDRRDDDVWTRRLDERRAAPKRWACCLNCLNRGKRGDGSPPQHRNSVNRSWSAPPAWPARAAAAAA
jgi:hypothetical protein